MTDNDSTVKDLEPGTRVQLLRDIVGSMENNEGQRVPTTALKGEIVIIYKKHKGEPRIPPRTSTSLSRPVAVPARTEYSLKHNNGGTWIPYTVIDGSDPRGVNTDQMIPHNSVAVVGSSVPGQTYHAPGDRPFVIEQVLDCVNVKAPQGRVRINIGDRVILTSKAMTRKGGIPRERAKAFYHFQTLRPGTPILKEWRTDTFYLPGYDFKVLED